MNYLKKNMKILPDIVPRQLEFLELVKLNEKLT